MHTEDASPIGPIAPPFSEAAPASVREKGGGPAKRPALATAGVRLERLQSIARSVIGSAISAWLIFPGAAHAEIGNGRRLYLERCAICHGEDARGTGALAKRSNPPTPDLTTARFKKRLEEYPGVIVSSVVLRPNGDLIPKTLRNNGVNIPPASWRISDLRDLDTYMKRLIFDNKQVQKSGER